MYKRHIKRTTPLNYHFLRIDNYQLHKFLNTLKFIKKVLYIIIHDTRIFIFLSACNSNLNGLN